MSINPGDDGALAVDEQPELVPDSTPATPNDGVEFLTSGKIRFTIDGAAYTLRLPRIGEFRRLHEMWVEGSKLETLTAQLDYQLRWVKVLFNGDPEGEPPIRGLSDHPISDNPDEWPAWVGVATYQAKAMRHFRDVPLALGGTAGQ